VRTGGWRSGISIVSTHRALAGHEQTVWLALIREFKPAPFVLERLIKLRESGRMTPELAHIWPTKPRSWAIPN